MERGLTLMIIIFFLGKGFAESSFYPECITHPSDVVFLLDGSGSVGNQRFSLIKNFVENLLLRLNIGWNTTRVGLMQFSGKAKTSFEFEINDYNMQDVKLLENAVQNISYHYGGLQETGFAMKIIGEKIFNGSDRPWASNVIVLIAEGPSTYPDKAFEEATKLKERGVHIVTIGVGNRISFKQFKNELNLLATSLQDVFVAKDDNLMALGDRLGLSLCPNKTHFPAVPTTTEVFASTTLSPDMKKQKSLYINKTKTSQVHHVTIKHTLTKIITSYVFVPGTCTEVVATSSVVRHASPNSLVLKNPQEGKETKRVKSRKLSGKQHSCFSCEYAEEVAKEFSVDCAQEECASNERYCADAVLEHQGRQFTKKSCASTNICNITGNECAAFFKHAAGFTECRVDCCEGILCNPYNGVSAVENYTFLFPIALLYFITHTL